MAKTFAKIMREEVQSDGMMALLREAPDAYALYWVLSALSDDWGRYCGYARYIRGVCLLEPEWPEERVETCLQTLEARRLLTIYESDGGDRRHLQLTDYHEKQKTPWTNVAESEHPDPPGWQAKLPLGAGLWVYLMACGDKLRIGVSKDPSKRLKQLQGQAHRSLRDIELLYAIPGSRELETTLHQRFTRHHTGGDWFNYHEDITSYFAALVPSEA